MKYLFKYLLDEDTPDSMDDIVVEKADADKEPETKTH